MKYFITSIMLLFLCSASKCVDWEEKIVIYKEEKLNICISFCERYFSFNDAYPLLYKARVKVLNDYILDKITKGELEDKKFEIQIYCDLWRTWPERETFLNLTQGKNGYFVSTSRFLSLQEFKTIVDNFANPDWKPFLKPERKNYIQLDYLEILEKKVDDFFKQNTQNETIIYQPFLVWEKDGVSLEYSGDSLRYLFNNIPFQFSASQSLPVKIQDRYLFFQQDSIFVVQDMEIIKSVGVNPRFQKFHKIEVFMKWVNIFDTGHSNSCIYSYSYDKNKFYVKCTE